MKLKPRTSGGLPGLGSSVKAIALVAAIVCSPSLAQADWDKSNTVTVVDTSPVNWLSVTWNTMEELVRVDSKGNMEIGRAHV